MKRKNLAKKLAALMMTSVMVIPTGITAFASEAVLNPGTGNGFPIVKKVATDENNTTCAPDTTFYFNLVAGGEEESLNYATAEGEKTVYDIQEGLKDAEGNAIGLSIDDGSDSAQFTSSMAADRADGSIYTNATEAKVLVDTSVFDNADLGVYHYILSENIPAGTTEDPKYPGITYDESVYHIYVFALEESGERVYNYIAYKAEDENADKESAKTDTLEFTNDYGKEYDTTHKVTITKELSGNQASSGDPFEFTIKVEPDGGNEKFWVEVAETSDVSVKIPYTLDSTNDYTKTVSIKGTGTIEIYGLTEGDVITVDEADYSGKGYKTTYDVEDDNTVKDMDIIKDVDDSNKEDKVTFKVVDDTAKIVVTNARSATTPTGIAMTFAPYIVMVAFAGVFAVMFLRKKREDF